MFSSPSGSVLTKLLVLFPNHIPWFKVLSSNIKPAGLRHLWDGLGGVHAAPVHQRALSLAASQDSGGYWGHRQWQHAEKFSSRCARGPEVEAPIRVLLMVLFWFCSGPVQIFIFAGLLQDVKHWWRSSTLFWAGNTQNRILMMIRAQQAVVRSIKEKLWTLTSLPYSGVFLWRAQCLLQFSSFRKDTTISTRLCSEQKWSYRCAATCLWAYRRTSEAWQAAGGSADPTSSLRAQLSTPAGITDPQQGRRVLEDFRWGRTAGNRWLGCFCLKFYHFAEEEKMGAKRWETGHESFERRWSRTICPEQSRYQTQGEEDDGRNHTPSHQQRYRSHVCQSDASC